MNTKTTTEASRLLSGERIERGQISLAQSLLNNLPRQTEEDDNFFKLQQILLDMVDNGQEVIDINSMQEAELLNIAATASHTAYLAQSLLYTAKGHEFPLQLPQLPGLQGNGYTAFKSGSDNLPVSELYPNPANQTAQLNYRLPDQTTATLTIYNLTGRIMHTAVLKNNGTHIVPVHNYAAGIYYYTISINGVMYKRNKLVIVN